MRDAPPLTRWTKVSIAPRRVPSMSWCTNFVTARAVCTCVCVIKVREFSASLLIFTATSSCDVNPQNTSSWCARTLKRVVYLSKLARERWVNARRETFSAFKCQISNNRTFPSPLAPSPSGTRLEVVRQRTYIFFNLTMMRTYARQRGREYYTVLYAITFPHLIYTRRAQ